MIITSGGRGVKRFHDLSPIIESAMLISKTVNVFRHTNLTAWFIIRGIIRLDVNDRCPIQYIQPS